MDIKDQQLLAAAGVPEAQIKAIAILVNDAQRTAAREAIRAVQRAVEDRRWINSNMHSILADLDNLINQLYP